jgi:hypothetical protein
MDQITLEQNTGYLKIMHPEGGYVRSANITDILLFKILEKLEEIRCGLIDIEEKLP